MYPYVPQIIVLFPCIVSIACLSSMSMMSFMRSNHAFMEGVTIFFQNLDISCLTADKKNWRRFDFWDLAEARRIDRSAFLGEGVSNSSYILLCVWKTRFQNGRIRSHSHQMWHQLFYIWQQRKLFAISQMPSEIKQWKLINTTYHNCSNLIHSLSRLLQ